MKKLKFTSLLLTGIISVGFVSGCSSNTEELKLDPKHKPLPDYVLNSSDKVQETYVMAATYPEVLASVPCYCGCNEQDGHISNLDCYIDQMDSNNAVKEWDPMSISWDICIDIAREAVEMNQNGKSLKDINRLIREKYKDFGTPTPTPEPK